MAGRGGRRSIGHGLASGKDCKETDYGEPVRSEQGRQLEALVLTAGSIEVGKSLPSTHPWLAPPTA